MEEPELNCEERAGVRGLLADKKLREAVKAKLKVAGLWLAAVIGGFSQLGELIANAVKGMFV